MSIKSRTFDKPVDYQSNLIDTSVISEKFHYEPIKLTLNEKISPIQEKLLRLEEKRSKKERVVGKSCSAQYDPNEEE